jgi:hypothetical protein
MPLWLPSSRGDGSPLWLLSRLNGSTGYAIHRSTLESKTKVRVLGLQREMPAGPCAQLLEMMIWCLGETLLRICSAFHKEASSEFPAEKPSCRR